VAAPGATLYAATKHAALAFSVGTLLDLRRDGVRDIHISAVCPDGIWTPMLQDKVNDPEAALSWSGVMLEPDDVARRALALLERPRPVLSIPRWRGGFARLFAAFPGPAIQLLPLVLADARRRQRA
jgi:short-subunit dehydrogenase